MAEPGTQKIKQDRRAYNARRYARAASNPHVIPPLDAPIVKPWVDHWRKVGERRTLHSVPKPFLGTARAGLSDWITCGIVSGDVPQLSPKP